MDEEELALTNREIYVTWLMYWVDRDWDKGRSKNSRLVRRLTTRERKPDPKAYLATEVYLATEAELFLDHPNNAEHLISRFVDILSTRQYVRTYRGGTGPLTRSLLELGYVKLASVLWNLTLKAVVAEVPMSLSWVEGSATCRTVEVDREGEVLTSEVLRTFHAPGPFVWVDGELITFAPTADRLYRFTLDPSSCPFDAVVTIPSILCNRRKQR